MERVEIPAGARFAQVGDGFVGHEPTRRVVAESLHRLADQG
jgi:hypothetical protein